MFSKLSEKELEQALTPYEAPRRFVYYDDFSNVTAISNIDSLGGNYIEVPDYRIDEFLTSGKDFNRYKVEYFKTDAPTKEVNDHVVSHLLYMIPVLKEQIEKELTILYDKKNKFWKFVLNESGKQKINLENKNKIFSFYITRYRNPNFLLSTIQVTGNDLIQNKKVKIEVVHELSKISIFTSPNFESYGIKENVAKN